MTNTNTNRDKVSLKPASILAPIPPVMVTCQGKQGRPNIITIAWAGSVCSIPPMVSISVRPDRYSYALIKESGEFVINLTDKNTVKACDMCGILSGKNCDKFHETGLTIGQGEVTKAPIILESPVNIECKIKQEIELGSHNMFIAEIKAIQVSRKLIDELGALHIDRASLVGFAHGHYYQLGKQLGSFGFSVKKK